MIENKELALLKGRVSRLETQANSVTIETAEDYAKMPDLLSKLKEEGSKIRTTKEGITKPLNEALKNARDLFRPIEEQFEKAESIIKSKILGYSRKVNDEARAREAKIAADLESGKIKKIETAERKIEAIERVEQTTRGSVGQIQVRKMKKVRIIDEAKLPRKYLEPNMVAIRRDALSGIIIPGTEVFEEENVAGGTY